MSDAEKSVIGCLVMNPALLDKARAMLAPKMFEDEPLARVYSCMLKLQKRGMPVDVVTILSKLGNEYGVLVQTCAETVPSLSNFAAYCTAVLDAWRERVLLEKLNELIISGHTADELTQELEKLTAGQRAIMHHVRHESEQGFVEAVGNAYKNLFKPDTSIKTDWSRFNEITGGFQRGCLYIIAARPGDGKTDIAVNLAVQIAKRNTVDYRSLEMSTEQLVHRILSRACSINSTKFRDKEIGEEEQKLIGVVLDKMQNLHLVMDDTANVSIEDIESKLSTNKPDVMVIDYLGLIRATDAGKKPLWQITGEITHALKAGARKHNAAIIALVQLGRATDKQKEPTLSDLKGGSDIEADADAVFFIRPHKTEDFLSGDDSWGTDLIVAKNRYGGTGKMLLHWQPQYHDYLPVTEREEE